MESKIRIIDNRCETSEANLTLNIILKDYQNLILSSVGPINSKFKLIQTRHDSDGLFATTTSKNLLESIYKINEEKIRENDSLILIRWKFDLISSALIKSHINSHFDSGFFAAFLINQSILLHGENKTITKIFAHLIEHLNSLDTQLVKLKLNLDNLNHLKALVNSCLNSKKVTANSDNQFSNLFLKLLIKSFNNDHFSRILYIFNEDMALGLNDSEAFDGILVKTDLLEFDSVYNLKCLILDSNCLSGDFEEFDNFEFKFQINISELKCENERFLNLNYLIDRIKKIVEQFKIDIIFCQKVVHPSIKHYFKKNSSLLFVDRLGINLAKPIQEILNCKMCNSISYDLVEPYIGYLDSMSLVNLHGKNYYHLQSRIPLQTIVVGVQNESFTSDMEHVLKVTERTFQRGVLSGNGLIGGPCFYTYCASFLWSKLENERDKIKNLVFIKDLFYKFLIKLTNLDCEYGLCLNSGHFFKVSSQNCECGMIYRKNEENLLDLKNFDIRGLDTDIIFKDNCSYEINLKNLNFIDCYQSKINALKIARDVLSTFLHIGVLVTN